TGSTAALGVSVALQALPLLLLGPWGGALADRLPLRPLVAATQLAQAGCAVALLVLTVTGTADLLALQALALVQGLVQVVDGPAHGLFGQQLVPEQDLPNAAALGSVSSSGGRVLGMALGGVAVGTVGAPALFAVNALSFAVVVAVVLRLPRGAVRALPRAAASDGSVRAGLRYALDRRELLVLLALVLVSSSLGRNFAVTTAALVHGPLGGGAAAYAAVSTCFALGALLGGLVAARLATLTLRVVLASAGLAAVGQVLAAGSGSLPVLEAVMVPVAAACVVLDTAVGSHLALDTPPSLRGRVLALRGVVSAAAAAGGAPLLGALADLLGPRQALAGAGLVVAVAVVLAAAALRVLAVRAGSWSGWLRVRATVLA
ncbi:MAG: MFS transporter, partial [Nocardioidaceae bacterium]